MRVWDGVSWAWPLTGDIDEERVTNASHESFHVLLWCCNMNRSVVSYCLQRYGPIQVPSARHEEGAPRSEHVRNGRILGAGGDSTRECCHTRTGLHSR